MFPSRHEALSNYYTSRSKSFHLAAILVRYSEVLYHRTFPINGRFNHQCGALNELIKVFGGNVRFPVFRKQ